MSLFVFYRFTGSGPCSEESLAASLTSTASGRGQRVQGLDVSAVLKGWDDWSRNQAAVRTVWRTRPPNWPSLWPWQMTRKCDIKLHKAFESVPVKERTRRCDWTGWSTSKEWQHERMQDRETCHLCDGWRPVLSQWCFSDNWHFGKILRTCHTCLLRPYLAFPTLPRRCQRSTNNVSYWAMRRTFVLLCCAFIVQRLRVRESYCHDHRQTLEGVGWGDGGLRERDVALTKLQH